jgi:hypothetical protein
VSCRDCLDLLQQYYNPTGIIDCIVHLVVLWRMMVSVQPGTCLDGAAGSRPQRRNHTSPIYGQARQAKHIQKTITKLLNGVHHLAKRLPEGTIEWAWFHTKGPHDQHSILYTCESPNLQVLFADSFASRPCQ